MFGILDALENFDIAKKVVRKFDLTKQMPDEFEYADFYGTIKTASLKQKTIFDYDPYKTSMQYYRIAFAYYWEYAILCDMHERKVCIHKNQTRFEMIQSLRPINELCEYVLRTIQENPQGTNWQRYILNRGYARQYGKSLCEVFLKNPATLDSLVNAALSKEDKRMFSYYNPTDKNIIVSSIKSLDDTEKASNQHCLCNLINK